MDSINTTMGRSSGTRISFSDIINANSARKTIQRDIQRNTPLLLYWHDNFDGGTIGAQNGLELTYVNFPNPALVAKVNEISSLKVAPYTRVTLYDGSGAGVGRTITFDGYTLSSTFNRALVSTDYMQVSSLRSYGWNDCIDSFKIEAIPQTYLLETE